MAIYAARTSLFAAVSYYLSDEALVTRSVSKADLAVSYDPLNCEAFQTRAQLQLLKGKSRDAINDLRSAINLRPFDYLLWLKLGEAYSQNNDFTNALNSYQTAIDLAPNYAAPKWTAGLLCLQEKNYDIAFGYLNKAANKDPELFPELLKLAQSMLSDDRLIDRAIQPDTILAKKITASYFIEHNINSEKNENFLTGDEIPDTDKSGFANRLIQVKNFPLAYKVWASQDRNKPEHSETGDDLLLNGGFELEIDTSNAGFGWQINRSVSNVEVMVNDGFAFKGRQSLLLNFQGNSDPNIPILSQLVLLQPERLYRLTFAVSTEGEMVTGGLPAVTITDPIPNDMVARSAPIQSPDGKWKTYTVNFRTTSLMKAAVININRSTCPFSPCPAFGSVRFDDFQLKPV